MFFWGERSREVAEQTSAGTLLRAAGTLRPGSSTLICMYQSSHVLLGKAPETAFKDVFGDWGLVFENRCIFKARENLWGGDCLLCDKMGPWDFDCGWCSNRNKVEQKQQPNNRGQCQINYVWNVQIQQNKHVILRTSSYEICHEQTQSNLPSLVAEESKQALRCRAGQKLQT